jgi:uncharacterized YccA/Bax inhibitor family protein
MQSRNPVLSRNAAFSPGGYATFTPAAVDQLETQYAAPPATGAQTGRMTLDDVVMKTGILFAVLLATSFVSWKLDSFAVVLVGLVGGLVLGLIISFRQSTNPALILAYAAFEGLLVGGISNIYQSQADGPIVGQAVIGTIAAFTAMLVLYKTGVIRATKKFTKMLLIAAVGYLLVGVANLVAAILGVGGGWGFAGSGLGILICVAGVAIASLFLILDFDMIEQGVRNGAPREFAWFAAFGLMVTLVWIYLEILRLLAILNRR